MTTRMKQLTWSGLDEAARLDVLARPAVTRNPEMDNQVAEIIRQVRENGDDNTNDNDNNNNNNDIDDNNNNDDNDSDNNYNENNHNNDNNDSNNNDDDK